jgi:hypothetical protein
MEGQKQMNDDQDSASACQPQFDDEQWTYLLRQDALMTQLVKHTATLELLHTYYREITAALHRRPTPELHTLQANTVARIRAVTASAAQVLAQVDQATVPPDIRRWLGRPEDGAPGPP